MCRQVLIASLVAAVSVVDHFLVQPIAQRAVHGFDLRIQLTGLYGCFQRFHRRKRSGASV
jgi:hypothetical protein